MTTCGFGNDISQAFKAYAPESHHIYYRPPNEVCEGYSFTHVCRSFQEGVSLSVHAGIQTPWEQTPPGSDPLGVDTHQEQTSPKQTPTPKQTPPRADTPQSSACWEIRAITGRYASYWNAYLFSTKFCTSQKVLTIPYLDRSVFVY